MRAIVLTLAGTLALSSTGWAAEPATKTIVVPAGTDQSYDEWHYAPAVRVGDMVIASGVTASGAPTYEGTDRKINPGLPARRCMECPSLRFSTRMQGRTMALMLRRGP